MGVLYNCRGVMCVGAAVNDGDGDDGDDGDGGDGDGDGDNNPF